MFSPPRFRGEEKLTDEAKLFREEGNAGRRAGGMGAVRGYALDITLEV